MAAPVTLLQSAQDKQLKQGDDSPVSCCKKDAKIELG
ncbi:hypothetical protein SPACI_023160 [Sporomusa acidovorans DSM 3132]|uniref:Uncharacterized protein n=1 Tax=Sporomusa acidovorans (strain ATCC 49682 / DSM 3132 / Mol) TaxID=1123286 RepID=A0ABZ3J244_SPOA4|nr:hypothetical protein SPACI_08440 [Sporomusa acidovorans DSM 3132]SDE97305.1 hypothetical protein SAMN04488499_102828 [Sporomusa acidovorans]